jgi:hypothetical protein
LATELQVQEIENFKKAVSATFENIWGAFKNEENFLNNYLCEYLIENISLSLFAFLMFFLFLHIFVQRDLNVQNNLIILIYQKIFDF